MKKWNLLLVLALLFLACKDEYLSIRRQRQMCIRDSVKMNTMSI